MTSKGPFQPKAFYDSFYVRKHFLTVGVTEHWHRLPREVLDTILGGIQKPSGHSPGQLALLRGWVGQMTNTQRSLPPSIILRYCLLLVNQKPWCFKLISAF